MASRPWFAPSLARKISLLFGGAVLLTIGVTLAFPWLQMTALDEQAMLLQAKRIASAAFQAIDLGEPRWDLAGERLRRRWPSLAHDLDLPPVRPQLVLASGTVGGGFQRDAVDRLRSHPKQRYYWRLQNDGRLFRFAMAVRGVETDPHPHVLRGIIDIRLAVPRAPRVWNAAVTVLAGASGALLAILVFYLVTERLVLTPVHALRGVAEKVTKGDISVRSAISSGDEFEDLSETLNEMLSHLRAAQAEQEKINRSLDIKLGELAETNVALYESNRLKNQFLANVTHELRTPLVSIIGFAELLCDAADNPATDRSRLARYSRNILHSGRSLLDIINDLLDLAKIEAGKLELHLSEFDLAELCRDLIDFVQPLADKRRQRLSLHVGDSLPPCHSDAGKIKQILYNLLSNAVKFTPAGGAVRLGVEANGRKRVRLTVQDNGPGIPEDQREVIFEKFRQLDASTAREHEGTGLGLAITKDLAVVLGGTVNLQSVEGEGSTFIVELPVRASDAANPSPISLT
ncbi:MAG: ATP-binding protein [Phycisphaerae bacterium]